MARTELGPHGGLTKGNRRLIAGLAWAPIAVATEYKASRRRIAEANGGDATALWRAKGQSKAQVGVAKLSASGGSASYALAATLAHNLGDDWVALTHLDNGSYAVIAVPKGGAIARDLVGPLEVAVKAWHSEIAEAQDFNVPYKHLYVDAPIDGVEGKLLPSSALNPVDAKTGRLEALGRGGKRAPTAKKVISVPFMIAGLVGLGVIGLLAYQRMQAHDLAERRRLHKASMANATPAAPEKVAEVLPPEWETRPSATDVFAACQGVEAKIPLAIGGWKIVSAECSINGIAVVKYQRYGVATNVSFIKGVIDVFGRPPHIDHDDGDVTVPVPMPAPRKEQLLGADQAQAMIQSQLQSVNVAFQLPEMPPPKATEGHPAPIRPWKQWSLSIPATDVTPVATRELPNLMFGTFDMPGLRITKITATRDDGKATLSWAVEGDLYAK